MLETRQGLEASDLVEHRRQLGGPLEGQLTLLKCRQPMRLEVVHGLFEGVVNPAIPRPIDHAGNHLDRPRSRDRRTGHHRFHPHLRVLVHHPFGQQPQGILQPIVPASHHASGVGTGTMVLGLQHPDEHSRANHLQGLQCTQRLVEVVLVERIPGIQFRHPEVQLVCTGARIPVRQFTLGLVAAEVLRRLQGLEHFANRRLLQVLRPGDRSSGLGVHQTPDPSVCLVAFGISVGIVLVAGDRVVPVDDVDRPIGSLLHIDRPEIAVPRLQDRLLPVQGEAGPFGPYRKPLDPVRLEVADHKAALHRLGHTPAVEVSDPAIPTRIADARELESVSGRDLAGREVGDPTGPVDAEDLAPAVKRHSPRVARSHAGIQQRVHLQPAWPEPIEARLEQVARPPGRLNPRLATVALTEIQLAAGAPDERIDGLVRVSVAKPAQQHATTIGSTITVGIFQKQDLGVLADIDPTVAPLHARRNVQSFGEHDPAVCRAVSVGVFEPDDLVVGQVAGEHVRIGRGHRNVHATRGVPPQSQRVGQPVRVRGEQVYGEALGNLERGQLGLDVRLRRRVQHLGTRPLAAGVGLARGNRPHALLGSLDQRQQLLPLLAKRN